jgi:hypothetical protein
MIFAYKMNDTTSNPLAYKPDYISQAGNKGNYKLMGLLRVNIEFSQYRMNSEIFFFNLIRIE